MTLRSRAATTAGECTQFEQFAAGPLRAQPRMLGLHWLKQRDELLGQPGTAGPGTALEPPGEAEPLAMPMEQGVEFEHHQGLLPRARTAREKQEGETVPPGQVWFLDWAWHAQCSEWRAEEDLLDQELGLGAGETRTRLRAREG